MDNDTRSYLIPEEMVKAGATQVAAEIYPPRVGRIVSIFAYRYFNNDDREVGYKLTCGIREYFLFVTPRVWADHYLRNLCWGVETHPHKPE